MSNENQINCKCCSCLSTWHLGVDSAVISWEGTLRLARGGLKRKFAEEGGGSREAVASTDRIVEEILGKVDLIAPASEEDATSPTVQAQLRDVLLAKQQAQPRKWQCTKCGTEQDYVW